MLNHHTNQPPHARWGEDHERSPQSSLWQSAPQALPNGMELLTLNQLSRFLGGLGIAAGDLHGALEATRLELMPGDELYAQGTVARYAYIVESGLVQCVGHQGDGGDFPGLVGFACAGELVGLYDQQERRSESVSMVTRGTLLALPLDGLKYTQGASPQLAELIARRLCLATKRDWRIVYRLRDLPPDRRAVAGLAHLVYLAAPDGQPTGGGGAMQIDLRVAVLRRWLGLSLNELMDRLEALEHDAALVLKGDRVVALMPQKILSALSALNQKSAGTAVGGSDFSESKPSVSD